MSATFTAKKTPKSIRVYREGERRGELVATIRAVNDGPQDALLRAYGYKVLGDWSGEEPVATATLVSV